MKYFADKSDIVTCYFLEPTEYISDSGTTATLEGLSTIKLKHKIVNATSATIFRNGNLCIRMIHAYDSEPKGYSIGDFLDPESDACNDPEYELINVALHGCPKIAGVNYAIGLAHIHSKSGVSVVGSIHKWYEQSLEDYIDSQVDNEIFNAPESIRIVEKLAHIMKAVHDAGYLHTDIKPDNILLDDQLNPVISDIDSFLPIGSEGLCVGTAEYMSPEMMNFDFIGPETDTWAFSQMLYDLLIDRPSGLFDYHKIKDSNYDIDTFVGYINDALDALRDMDNGKDGDERHFKVTAAAIYDIIVYRPVDLRDLVETLRQKIDAIYTKE